MENLENISTQYIDDIQKKSVDNFEHLKNAGIGLTHCAKEAHSIVDKVIESSSNHLLENDEQVPNITWLAVKNFSVENGINKIHEFIKVHNMYCYNSSICLSF